MDLIEVLWKQDVDLGFTLVEPTSTEPEIASTSEKKSADDIEKLKALEAINATKNEVSFRDLCINLQITNPQKSRLIKYTHPIENIGLL